MQTRVQPRRLNLKNRTRARGGRRAADPRRACRRKLSNCIELDACGTKSCIRLESFSNDPIGFAAGDANLYRYVGNQPTTKTDPSGLEPPPGYIPWRDPLTGGESCIGRLQKLPQPRLGYDWHYDRNRFNHPPGTESEAQGSGWDLVPPERSIYHQHNFGDDNTKYHSPDGAMEGVYDGNGNIVTSPDNLGTYNYGSDDLSHMKDDVLPYWVWGNSPDDPVPLIDRIGGPGATPSWPQGPSDSDLGDLIEAIIGQSLFP